MKKCVLCLWIGFWGFLFAPGVSGQQFADVSEMLSPSIIYAERSNGSGVSFYDVNRDGWDDLTFANPYDSIYIYLNQGGAFARMTLLPPHGFVTQLLWGDYDNDGDADLFVSIDNGISRLYRNDGEWTLTDVTQSSGLPMTTNQPGAGASWCDINQDGWLDLYHCQYGGSSVKNKLYFGSPSGTFSDVSVAWGAGIGSSYSFQASVVDYDFDGDPDIHVANDRVPIDAFLLNEGSFFINAAQGLGFDVYCNSMSSSPCDFDKDGEYEIMVTNTEFSPHYFWKKNSNGFYQDIAAEQGVHFPRRGWASLWIDADNDSWEDLYIANWAEPEDEQPFFMNISGQLQRTAWIEGEGGVYGYSAAKGDMDNDGYYDFALSTADDASPKLYRNNGGNNHWLKLRLQGVTCNNEGIGTLIEYYIGGERNIRFTRSGDSYLTQDSQWLILSAGEAESIDTLRLTWPNGIRETYYDIMTRQTIILTEGNPQSFSFTDQDNEPVYTSSFLLCSGQSLQLTAQGFVSYVWSTGETGATIVISEPGEYWVQAVDFINGTHISSVFYVSYDAPPQPETLSQDPSCYGFSDGWVSLTLDHESGWWFDGGESTLFMEDLGAGEYVFGLSSDEGCISSLSAVLDEPAPLDVLFTVQHILCAEVWQGAIEITDIHGGFPPFVIQCGDVSAESPGSGLQLGGLHAGIWSISLTDTHGCVFQTDLEVLSPEPLQASEIIAGNGVQIVAAGGVAPYQLWWNGVISDELNIEEPLEGSNPWTLFDANGCTVSGEFEWTVTHLPESVMNAATHFWDGNSVFIQAAADTRWEIYDTSGRCARAGSGNTVCPWPVTKGRYILRVQE